MQHEMGKEHMHAEGGSCCAHAKKECSSKFNYCFWAKAFVAIPALPVAAHLAMLPFGDSPIRWVAAVAMVLFLVWAAIKIDKLPSLQKKVVDKGAKE